MVKAENVLPLAVKLKPTGIEAVASSHAPVCQTVPPVIGVYVPDLAVNAYDEATCPYELHAAKTSRNIIVRNFLIFVLFS
jgi:hypothetical protein